MARIEPTVGRVVLFHDGQNIPALAATIAFVHPGGELVNLGYLVPTGEHRNAMQIPLIQEGESAAEGVPYCEWMPYQLGQAAKTQQLEQQLAADSGVPGT